MKISVSSDNDDDFSILSNIKHKSSNGKILMDMSQSIKYIQSKLNKELITKILDAFESNQSAYELEDDFNSFLTPPLAKSLSRSYDEVSRILRDYKNEGDLMVKSVLTEDAQATEKLRDDEHKILMLYENMDQAIKEKTKFLIQAQEIKILSFPEHLFNNYIQELCMIFEQFELSMKKAVLADWKNKSKIIYQFSSLPEEIFNISEPIFVESKDRKKEFAGTESYYVDVTKTRYEEYTEHYKERFLFFFKKDKTRTSTRPVKYTDKERKEKKIFKDVEYTNFSFPKPITMARQWSDAVDQDKNILWKVLQSWMNQYVDKFSDQFELVTKEILDYTEHNLSEKLNAFDSDLEYQQQLLQVIQPIFQKLLELRKEALQ
ncbi:hypothetical protein IQ218_06615 [Synechocystis salina LEGE 06099]|uniref:hypothetical protein n=1 Tax=Synechocystis salina TaxID=945780 RepID=UPI00187E5AAD|nr:hypothetical protein [Synechocystis salina]MBE9203180.1 hypothetical protein [Synechocystis salina LEGE 06099]